MNVLLIGASCRAAAQCSVRAGHSVVAIDHFGDRDLSAIATTHVLSDFSNVAATIASDYPKSILILAGGMENYPHVVDSIRNESHLAGVSGDSLRSLRNRKNWQRWGAATGLKMPLSIFEVNQPGAAIEPAEGVRWLFKPFASAGGIGIRHVTGTTTAFADFLRDGQSPRQAYLQRFLSGKSLGVSFLSYSSGSSILGAVGSWDQHDVWGPSEFIYRGNYGPIDIAPDLDQRLSEFAKIVSQETGILGLWQADFLWTAGEWYLLEINPRWTAGMELLDLGLGMRLIDLHCSAVMGHPNAPQKNRRPKTSGNCVGKMIAYARQDFRPSNELIDYWWERRWCERRWSEQLDASGPDCCLADIPVSTCLIPSGFPILTCMSSADNSVDLGKRLAGSVAQINAMISAEQRAAVTKYCKD